jgi:hypothetical protein
MGAGSGAEGKCRGRELPRGSDIVERALAFQGKEGGGTRRFVACSKA